MTEAGRPLPHESARGHVTGEARYTDDLTGRFPNLLHAWPVVSPHAHARITSIDHAPALAEAGRGHGPDRGGCAGQERHRRGSPRRAALSSRGDVSQPTRGMGPGRDGGGGPARRRAGRRSSTSRCRPSCRSSRRLPPSSYLTEPLRLSRGDVSALTSSALVFDGELAIGGQEHFYLETQCAIAWLDESGGVSLHSSTQHPSETQDVVARVLGLSRNQVTVECLRMGGAFGGKEVQANPFAAVAALGAWKTGRPVRVRLTRAARHRDDRQAPSLSGALLGRLCQPTAASRRCDSPSTPTAAGAWICPSRSCGARSSTATTPIGCRPSRPIGRVCLTHKTSQTAFRGFGGPQAMVVIEDILSQAAHRLSLPPDLVRERNLYRDGDTTHYGQEVGDAGRLAIVWSELKRTSDFAARRSGIDAFNAAHPHRKRGLAITPVKFGISFTATFFNQAGALVLVYRDGSVQVSHGGTEMGQGLFTKVQQIAADSLGVPLAQVRMMPTRTDKVPNTSATAASAGTDLNGAAVMDACAQIRSRLSDVAADLLAHGGGRRRIQRRRRVGRQDGRCRSAICAKRRTTGASRSSRRASTARPASTSIRRPGAAVRSTTLPSARRSRRSRSTDSPASTGCSGPTSCRTSAIRSRRSSIAARSKAVSSRAWAGSRSRSCSGTRTGGSRPAAHPPTSCRRGPSCPTLSRSTFWRTPPQPGVVFGSKAVGEPPLMLAISVREALRDAVVGVRPERQRRPRLSGHTRAGVLRGTPRPRRAAGAPMSAGELLRATLFHTPANPFHDARALQCHTDGGLLVRDGRIVMAGDYRRGAGRGAGRHDDRLARRVSVAGTDRHPRPFPAAADHRQPRAIAARLARAGRASGGGAHGRLRLRAGHGARLRARARVSRHDDGAGVRRALRAGDRGALRTGRGERTADHQRSGAVGSIAPAGAPPVGGRRLSRQHRSHPALPSAAAACSMPSRPDSRSRHRKRCSRCVRRCATSTTACASRPTSTRMSRRSRKCGGCFRGPATI